MRRLLLFVILFGSMTIASCKIPVYTMSDKQVTEHYKNKKVKPVFRYLTYNSYRIYHAVVGDSSKPLLVYLHGAPGHWYSAMKLLDDTLLQKNFRMLSLDRAGFGKSNNGLSLPSIDKHVRYIEKLVKEYNVTGKKIYIIGSSYGGPIAASFVTQNPSLVQELYLLSPILDPSTEKMFWFSYLAKFGFINWLLPQSLNATSDEKSAHPAELRKLKPYLKNIRCKTYVIMGENDWIANPSNFTFAQRMLENAHEPVFIKLKNTGHTIVYRHADLLVDLLMHRQAF
ncbi:MAG TPA: alpha/beta hydrolase [Chitinophagaceae bacterium]